MRTMTPMTVPEYLSQGRRLNEMILFQTERLKRLRESADGISAVRADGEKVKQSPSGDAPYVRALQRIWELQEAIGEQLQLLIRLDLQIGQVIGTLLNADYRMTLCYRYLDRKTWDQIADLMHIDPSTAKRWHAKAVCLLTLPEDAICLREAGTLPAA